MLRLFGAGVRRCLLHVRLQGRYASTGTSVEKRGLSKFVHEIQDKHHNKNDGDHKPNGLRNVKWERTV
jgi:hypothetical protein